MKNIVTVVVLICMLCLALSGCSDSAVSLGTYRNENNAEEQIIITQNSIQFINVSFDEFNKELHQDMGADIRLTDFLSDENTYTSKDGVLSVNVESDMAVSFKYGKNYIFVNGKNFRLN